MARASEDGLAGEDMGMADAALADTIFASMCSTFSRPLPECEIEVFTISAKKGDVFPACIRLSQARADEAWLDRLNIALAVGPACPTTVLDMACRYMPNATEPRLLRACASLRLAAMASDEEERALFDDAARRDLLDVIAIDHDDVTARILFSPQRNEGTEI